MASNQNITLCPSFLTLKTQNTTVDILMVMVTISVNGEATRRVRNISTSQFTAAVSQGQTYSDIIIGTAARDGFATEDELQSLVNPTGTTQFIFTFNTPDLSGGAVNYGGLIKVCSGIAYVSKRESLDTGSPLIYDYHFTATSVING